MKREVKQWITVRGKHIPIFEGESKEDAVKRAKSKSGVTRKDVEELTKKKDEVSKKLGKDGIKTQPITEDEVKAQKDFWDKNRNKQIDKDNDEKEKQIKQNEKESERLRDSSDYRTRSAEAALEAAKKHTGDKNLKMHKMDDDSYVIVGKNGSRAGIVKPEKNGNYTLNVRNKSERRREDADRRAVDNIVKGVKKAYGHADAIDGFKMNDKLTLSSMFSDKKGNFINDDVPVKIVKLGTKDGYGQNYNHAIVEYKNADGQTERQEIPISRLKKWQRKK